MERKSKMEWIVIDRLEEGIAICEKDNKQKREIPKDKLPLDVKEGDVLRVQENGVFQLDKEETERRKQEIQVILQSLLKKE